MARLREGWVNIYKVKMIKTEVARGTPKLFWNSKNFKLTPGLMLGGFRFWFSWKGCFSETPYCTVHTAHPTFYLNFWIYSIMYNVWNKHSPLLESYLKVFKVRWVKRSNKCICEQLKVWRPTKGRQKNPKIGRSFVWPKSGQVIIRSDSGVIMQDRCVLLQTSNEALFAGYKKCFKPSNSDLWKAVFIITIKFCLGTLRSLA